MYIYQSYDSLKPCLNSHLTDLCLNDKQEIVVNDNKTTSIGSDMVNKVKEQFNKLIQSTDVIDENDINKEIIFLENFKSQLRFLGNLTESTLVYDLFSKEEFKQLCNDKMQTYGNALDLTLRNFTQYAATVPLDQKDSVEMLREKLIQLNRHGYADRFNRIITEMEVKVALKSSSPDISERLSILPGEDRSLLYMWCGKTPDDLPNQQRLDRLIEMCSLINQTKDKEIQTQLKKYIVSFPISKFSEDVCKKFQDLIALGNEETPFKDFLSTLMTMSEENEKRRNHLMVWVTALLRDKSIQRLKPDEKIEKLKAGLLILEKNKTMPLPQENISPIKMLEFSINNPNHYQKLAELYQKLTATGLSPSLMRCAILFPEEFSILLPFLPEKSKIDLVFGNLNIGQQRALLRSLAKVSLENRGEVIDNLIIWRNNSTWSLRNVKERLLEFGDIQTALSQVNAIPYDDSFHGDKFKAALKTKNEVLYKFLFEGSENPEFWPDPIDVSRFNQWLNTISFGDRKNEETWKEFILRTKPQFQQTLSQLFKIEESEPQLFENILQVALTDTSPQTLTLLIKIYHAAEPNQFTALLKFLQEDPTLIPLLSKIFLSVESNRFEDFLFQIQYLDAKTISFMLREGANNTSKFKDMLKINQENPQLFEKIIKIESSSTTPVLWSEYSFESYSRLTEKHLDILINNPTIREVYAKQSSFDAFWSEIPDEIWNIDPKLPAQLFKLKSEIYVDAHIRSLLLGAVAKGKDALAYKLLKLKEQGNLNKSMLALMIKAPANDSTANALAAICLKDTENLEGTLPFLNDKEWSDFVPVVKLIEKLYQLPSDGSIEERLQKLPIEWKWSLIKLITIGLENKVLIKPLCDLVLTHPQIPFIELFLNSITRPVNPILLNLEPALTLSEKKYLIEFFVKMPPKKIILPSDMGEKRIIQNDLTPIFKLLIRFKDQFKDQDSLAILGYFLPLSGVADTALGILKYQTDLFMPMIELDKKLGPPFGQVITSLFNKNTKQLLSSDPQYFSTVLKHVNINDLERDYRTFGPLYLPILESAGRSKRFSSKIDDRQGCLDALKKIDLKQVSHPNRFLERVAALASWKQFDALEMMLKWMEKNDYSRAEALFDMAKAGYVPEVITILTELEKNPTDEKYLRLLNKADSIHAAEIQNELAGITETPSETTFKPKTDDTLLEKVLARMKAFIEVDLKDVKEQDFKERCIETELSVALAASLLASGELTLIPRDHVEQLLDKVNIPKDSDFAIYLLQKLSYLEKDSRFSEILSQIKITIGKNSPAEQMVRRMLNLKENEIVTDSHAKMAAFSALLSRTRQSKGVGSCFGTAPTIMSQSDLEGSVESLKDYQSLLSDNALTRKIYGKHNGDYSFPCSLLRKKMQMPILNENLLLKARETAIASMAATKSMSSLFPGLIQNNLDLFSYGGFYRKQIEYFNDNILVLPHPIQDTDILEALKTSCRGLTKAVMEYEVEHPVSKELGWTYLARRDKEEAISNFDDYKKLHHDMLTQTFEILKKQTNYQSSQKYLSTLFDHLIQESQKKLPNETGLWRTDSAGGFLEPVMAVNLQFAGDSPPTHVFYARNPEQTLGLLMQGCDAFPEKEKESFLKEPERLTSLIVPRHGLSLKPYSLIKHLKEGKTVKDVVDTLMKPFNMRLDSIATDKRQEWMKTWIQKVVPVYCQKPFENAISALKWEEMTLDECGRAMMQTFLDVHKIEPDRDTLFLMEKFFFKVVPPDVLKSMPIQIVGDLNWDNEGYNNCYLGCARSPLTGQLTWYRCNRNGTDRYALHWEVSKDEWSLMSPISRKENGFLSYQSLTK